jgi:DNA (cytosine-5)-methyltransferase 1
MTSNKKYPEILEDAWESHLLPRKPNAPTVVSLFAGCGGSSLGYSIAGYRELLAVDWNENAIQTFKLNFPGIPVFHGDVAQLSDKQALKLAGLKPGELDVLDGSPPCQGFTKVHKRKLVDTRNQLYKEYVRLLQAFQPRAFVMENVSSMVDGAMQSTFVEILKELKSCGYQVSVRVLNTKYYSVPQSRKRVIFIGLRNGIPCHPEPIQHSTGFIQRPFTVRDAIETVVNHKLEAKPIQPAYAKRWSETRRGYDHHERFSLHRLCWNKPASTILSTVYESCTGMFHPDTCRMLSIGELQRIASYSDAFQFIGSYKEAHARIGNSVPPLFMKAIAQHVHKLLKSSVSTSAVHKESHFNCAPVQTTSAVSSHTLF